MYVKYLDNIHNIENYQSVVRVGENQILLVSNNHSTSLLFKDGITRDWASSHIWMQLKNHTEFLDLDSDVETFHTSEMYKI